MIKKINVITLSITDTFITITIQGGMKMKKKTISILLSAALVFGLTGCGTETGKSDTSQSGTEQTDSTNTETEQTADENLYASDASLKLWGSQEDQEYLKEAIEMFKEDYPDAAGWKIDTAVISGADAKDEVLKDPTTAADVFEFASDQLASLVEAGTLYKITSDRAAVEENNIENAAAATLVGDDMYGYPSTSNSYFLYYDKSMYTEEEVKSLDTMLEKDLGKATNFAMDLDNGWYMASFFFGAGCTLFGPDGQDPTECSFNNEAGVRVGNYILGLTHNSRVGNYDDTLLLSGFADRTLGATITGTWNANAIKDSLGDDFGVATFPKVTLDDGTEIQPSPIVNFNIYGINAQTKYPLESMLLANYLTSEKIQELRFKERNSTPVNKNLVSNKELLSSSPAVATLAEQTELASTVQPSIPQIANFWQPMEAFGQDCIAGTVTNNNMQEKLDVLVQSILAKISD